GGWFGGQRPSGNYRAGGYGGQQYDRNAAAQRQYERRSGLGTPEQRQAYQDQRHQRQGQRQDRWQQNQQQRQQQRDQARNDWQKHANNRREDWQDYADDHDYYGGYYGPGYYGGWGYAGTAAAAAAAGAAVGAAAGYAAAQPSYSLPCAGPATVVVGNTNYYQCGSTWYIRAYSGGEVAYT